MSCNDELQISPVEPKESNIPTDYSPNSPYGDGNSSSNHINEKIPIDDKNSIKPLISLIPIEDVRYYFYFFSNFVRNCIF